MGEGDLNGLNPYQSPKFWGCYIFFFYSSAISWVIISHQKDDRDDPLADSPIACLGASVLNAARV